MCINNDNNDIIIIVVDGQRRQSRILQLFLFFFFAHILSIIGCRSPQSRSHCLIGMLPNALFNIFLNKRPMLCDAAGLISWTRSLALVFKN